MLPIMASLGLPKTKIHEANNGPTWVLQTANFMAPNWDRFDTMDFITRKGISDTNFQEYC